MTSMNKFKKAKNSYCADALKCTMKMVRVSFYHAMDRLKGKRELKREVEKMGDKLE